MNSTTTKLNIDYEPLAINVWVKDRMIYFELTDFRIVAFPADRFKILSKASDEELQNVVIKHNGLALKWENLDEDITIKGILEGRFQI